MQPVSFHPKTKEAMELLHKGTLALAQVESNGMKIDLDWVKSQYSELSNKLDLLKNEIENSKEGKLWKEKYKEKFTMNSTTQLRDIIYNELGEKPSKVTNSGNAAVDHDVLTKLSKKYKFIADLLLYRKFLKARDTYLKNLINETVDGYLHPVFNLHTVRTFRSSSSNPNFQNIPIRDPDIGKIIRKAFVARGDDYIFGGCDYGAQEVKIAACYHKDPEMLKYLEGHGDLHKDVAAMCYKCTPDEVSKKLRKIAKNKFTFPQFYGDYYKNCANALWEQAIEQNVALETGVLAIDHLKEEGISNYDKFENHIKKVEYDFWNKKFKVYNSWKQKIMRQYARQGYVDLYTGFRCRGLMHKNDIINYPVQGAAFHCMLWSLIQLQEWLIKNKLKTKIVGQIHDEIVLDINIHEKDYVLNRIKEIMTGDIYKYYDWLIVPLEVEAEFSPPGGSWFEKQEITM